MPGIFNMPRAQSHSDAVPRRCILRDARPRRSQRLVLDWASVPAVIDRSHSVSRRLLLQFVSTLRNLWLVPAWILLSSRLSGQCIVPWGQLLQRDWIICNGRQLCGRPTMSATQPIPSRLSKRLVLRLGRPVCSQRSLYKWHILSSGCDRAREQSARDVLQCHWHVCAIVVRAGLVLPVRVIGTARL